MIRTTAGLAISTARTTGSETLPPGMPSANAFGELPATPPRKRHIIPTITAIGNKWDRRITGIYSGIFVNISIALLIYSRMEPFIIALYLMQVLDDMS